MLLSVAHNLGHGGAAHRRPPFFKTKKLGLLGCTENVQYAPFYDPTWTLASHTAARQFCKREPDWYFDLHRPECFQKEKKPWNDKYYTWLKKLQTPIFMQEAWPEIPLAVKYPIERILQERRSYLTNHCSFMIALAIAEGVDTIGLWGCQYGVESERQVQRGSLEYWLGYFEGLGGHVILPGKKNTLLDFPQGLYGYESHDASGKLTGDYARMTELTKSKTEKDGKTISLTPIPEGETRPAVAKPPNGEEIAWVRRELLPLSPPA
jgi:hypothetical protein